MDKPDFEKMLELAQSIGDTTTKVLLLEGYLDFEEAKIVRECFTNRDYFKSGKALAMNAIEKLYFYTGLNNELVDKRIELANLKGKLETDKLLYRIYTAMSDAWRTDSANQRLSM